MTVTTVMLNTTVTASAMTSANPPSSPDSRLSRFIVAPPLSDPRAVPQVDGVGELVRAEAVPSEADGKVDLQRGETSAALLVRKSWEGVLVGEVVGDLHARARTAGRTELPIEPVPIRVAVHGGGAPADIAAAS